MKKGEHTYSPDSISTIDRARAAWPSPFNPPYITHVDIYRWTLSAHRSRVERMI